MATHDDVRRLALGLPETTERLSYGAPAFAVAGRLFTLLRDDGDLVVWCADLGDKAALLAADPDVYWTTPHYDGYASVLVHLDRIDHDELGELLAEAWQARAPRPLRQQAGDPTNRS